ncbi:hypothetical protein ODS41_06190 [Pyrobaculum sp. 3827-6]|uniref:hypothetical protein n=1 Tax=Pyrobaculum sp. 3827-6 TaxID=2983604 RepID=UPI0021D8DE74|nr:hypothetical protein [Pyrobaculum sp. 3827-6]MCU7787504.1 hypothetical protein [Pyrobaculum sp. 3827-6]
MITEAFNWFLSTLGLIFLLNLFFKLLIKLSKSVEDFVNSVLLKIYYPIVSRIVKSEHKNYVKKRLRSLIPHSSTVVGIGYDIDIEWSDRESISLDLEKGLLIVRMQYTTDLNHVVAKALLMAAPYAVSRYLEPVFGPKMARLLAVSISRDYASKDVGVLTEFMRLVGETYNNPEEKTLLEYIYKADDESLYRHIVLFELRKLLEEFNGAVDKNKLENDVRRLLEVVGNLSSVDDPTVCGDYISLTIVRTGKLEKVLGGDWERYVNFINSVISRCRTLRRIYIVSAGKVISSVAKQFVNYLSSNIRGFDLIHQEMYKARRYRGRPYVTSYVAVFELTQRG